MKIPNFRGVFMRDDLPKKPYKNEFAIINLDSKESVGTHWTAYIKRSSQVLYFDSFGDLPPPKELQKYLYDCTIEYNHKQVQKFNTIICGHLCLRFLLQNS